MGAAAVTFECISPAEPMAALPARLVLAPAAGQTATRILLLTPIILVLSGPAFAALVLMQRLSPVSLLIQDPVTFLALALQPLMWLLVVSMATRATLTRLQRRIHAVIDRTRVRVADRSLFGLRVWSEPLSHYRGVAHNIRATLSGTQHEIVLVHANPARTIPLLAADRVSQTLLDHYAHLLRLPIIPARELYPLPVPALFSGMAAPTGLARV